MIDYQRELTVLAQELRENDPSLTEAESLALAKDDLLDLYTFALRWNTYVAALRSASSQAA